jgi:hypothetical protein
LRRYFFPAPKYHFLLEGRPFFLYSRITTFFEAKMANKIIAYCGIVCTECPGYKATQTGDDKLAQKTADEWSKAFNTQVKLEHVWCDGCTVSGKKCAHCGECEIRACAIKRGVENCGRCPDYGCEIISNFFEMVPAAKATLEQLRNG